MERECFPSSLVVANALGRLHVTYFLKRWQHFRDSVYVGKRLLGLMTNLFLEM